jgi:large subunit ribosomal protein L19e
MKVLRLQKKLAAQISKAGKSRIRFDTNRLSEIKDAITRIDIKRLISSGAISVLSSSSPSRHRARARSEKRKKGRQRGMGKRKGRATARTPKKRTWINKIRLQRAYLKGLKDNSKIDVRTYRNLYKKAGGGFFRSRNHMIFYIKQNNLLKS